MQGATDPQIAMQLTMISLALEDITNKLCRLDGNDALSRII